MIPKSLALNSPLFSQEHSPPVHLIYSCPSFRIQLSHHSLREALDLQLLLTWSVSPLHSFSVPRTLSICSYYSFNYTCIYVILCLLSQASLVAQMVKDLPAVQETWVWSLGWENPLEKGMATCSSIVAWIIPWTEEPGGLKSMGSQRVEHDWMTNTFALLNIALHR